VAISVLVFQDLAAIPLLAMLAIWQSGGQPGLVEISLEVLKVLAIFTVALALARPVLHWLLMAIYRRGNSELLVLAALAIIAMGAESAHLAGASAALGAFLAGLILGERDVRHRIEEDLRPFRDVFASIFFVSIGLQLDLSQLGSSPLAVLAWLLVLLPAKASLNFIALKISGSSARDALQTAVILAHGGEFGLLLLSGALTASLISTELGQPLLLALVVSMGLGPILFVRPYVRLGV
jgi:CPA2 family monovalent cation:H+ antiporter-2